MVLRKIFLLLLVFSLSGFAYAADIIVTRYGVKGDSTTLNSQGIQKTIDDCSTTGGGKVIFPAGRYISGTIVLKNNVTLLLQKGAMLLGSTNVEDYD